MLFILGSLPSLLFILSLNQYLSNCWGFITNVILGYTLLTLCFLAPFRPKFDMLYEEFVYDQQRRDLSSSCALRSTIIIVE